VIESNGNDAPHAAVEQMFKGFHERGDNKSPNELKRDHLAGTTRELLDAIIQLSGDVDEIEEATLLVREAELLVRKYVKRGSSAPTLAPTSEGSFGVGTSFLDRSPLIGSMNPVAPPIAIEIRHAGEGESGIASAIGRVTFDAIYEGPPGCVHGGIIAAAFDEVLGIAQSLSGNPGMTGQLTVRYRAPTPLYQPLLFEAHIDRIAGRKIFTAGTLHHGKTLCAEAEALFISMRPEVFERLLRIRREASE